MDKLERKVIYLSVAVMVVFAAMVLYAGYGMGIVLPSHHQDVAMFREEAIIARENNQFEVHYVSKMWAFEPAELVLPEHAQVHFYVSSIDVTHGFQVVGTNVNLMAVPGTVNAASHHFNKTGEYLVVCHEYCGLNHQKMSGKIRVVTAEEYARHLEEARSRLVRGEQLAAKYDCTSCHSVDGTEGIGPTFKGMYGRRTTLADGTEALIDEPYFFDSIRNPDRQIVKGHEPGSMPPSEISDEEIREILTYIETLQ